MNLNISGGATENGIIIGNTFNKYNSSNLIVKKLMQGFENALYHLINRAQPKSIHEIGCGEGYWVLRWQSEGISSRGSDFSEKIIAMAKTNAKNRGIDPAIFQTRNIYDISSKTDGADLIVCCEVLEHLERPREALKALQGVVQNSIILSVPREPIWRILNISRLKYLSNFGNTPGHIQNWSKKEFLTLVEEYFEILEVKSPLPWTMILLRKYQ